MRPGSVRIAYGCLFVTSTALLAACGVSRSSAPEKTGSSREALISDQLHNAGTLGFILLPPMVPAPADYGSFVPNVPATVRVDEVTATGTTVRTLATFTSKTGPEREHLRVHYQGAAPDSDDHDGDTDPMGF